MRGSRSHTFAPWIERLRVAPYAAFDSLRAHAPALDAAIWRLAAWRDASLIGAVQLLSQLHAPPSPSKHESPVATQPARARPLQPAPPVASRAPGASALIYAIGDVHGRDDLLARLLNQIEADAGDQPARLVMLGDYVDRGAGSRRVVDILLSQRMTRFETTYLKGNHEAALLRFLGDPGAGAVWCSYGGGDTLAAYGVTRPPADAPLDDWDAARRAFAAAIPAEHLAFYQALELYAVDGPYVFVHAGVRPGVPLHRQREQDLLWIRDEFLDDEQPSNKIVVHGHTPEEEPFQGRARIGLDTGAYVTGVLTAARLAGRSVKFLQARG